MLLVVFANPKIPMGDASQTASKRRQTLHGVVRDRDRSFGRVLASRRACSKFGEQLLVGGPKWRFFKTDA
jgi:hypothetical protein